MSLRFLLSFHRPRRGFLLALHLGLALEAAVAFGTGDDRKIRHDSLLQHDGRGSPTRITRHLFDDLGVTDFNGVLPQLYGKPHPAPAILASTRAVARAFAEGDAIAVNIVQRGARLLAGMAATVARELLLEGGPVYLAGGAFENVPPLEKAVRLELLSALPRAAVGPVGEEPAMGAARLAAMLAWGA